MDVEQRLDMATTLAYVKGVLQSYDYGNQKVLMKKAE